MTHEELLAKIDWIGETKNAESKTATPLGVAVLASLNALRAVVELHKAVYDPKYNVTLCDNTGCWGYPCPTIQAIEEHLK